MPGKRVQFDDETWHAVNLLARDSLKDFQELADEAFADLLKKYDRPVTLKAALRESARRLPANDDATPSSPAGGGKGVGNRSRRRRSR
jgi:hypothetical protein